MRVFPFSFFKGSSTGAAIAVDEVITFENLSNIPAADFATNAQVNGGTYGTLLSGFQFLASGTPHDPALSYKGSTAVAWPAWPAPLSVGGSVVPRTNNMAIVKNARTLNAEDGQWNFNTNTITKYLYGGMFYWNAPTANQNPGPTSMDLLSIQPTGGTAVGTWFQVNYAGTGLALEYETNEPFTGELNGAAIVTGRVYVFQAIVDHVAGKITTAWWDTSTTPWNQVGSELTTSTHVGTAASLALFELCPFNTATWNADPALFYFKDLFIQKNPTGFINVTLGLRFPDNFTATVTGFTSVALSWSSVSQASGYDIDQSIDGGVNWTNVVTNYNNNLLAVTGLTPNASYNYRIRSHVAGLLSNYGFSNQAVPHTVDWLGFWMLDNPGSGVATDLTSHGNNGTYPNGGTQVGGAGMSGFGSKLTPGSAQFVNLGNPALFQLSGSFTANVWVNFTHLPTITTEMAIMCKASGIGNGWNMCNVFGVSGSLSLMATVNRVDPWFNSNNAAANTVFTAGVWSMCTVTYDASTGTLSIYNNGALQSSGSVTPTAITDSGSALMVGITQDSAIFTVFGSTSPYYLDGAVQGAAIVNRAMSAAEVAAQFGPGGTVVAP